MTREELINGIIEVFDDTYGKAITRSAKEQSGKEIIHHARKLKALKGPTKKEYVRMQRGARKYA